MKLNERDIFWNRLFFWYVNVFLRENKQWLTLHACDHPIQIVQNLSSRLIQPTASSSYGLSWPRSFGLCLSKRWLTLDVKVFVYVDLNIACSLLKLWMTAALALFCNCSPQTSIWICSCSFTESEKRQAHGKSSNFSKTKSHQKEEEELLECYRREANFCCS